MDEVKLDAQIQNSKLPIEKKEKDDTTNKIEKILMENLSCETF